MQQLTQEEIIQNTIAFAKATLANAEGGHDWLHVERVYKNALLIAQGENVDHFIIALGALLHDIADSKFYDGNETVGPQMAASFLEKQQLDSVSIEHVIQIIKNISFKGGNTTASFSSPELDVLQDADRLDAIGAIGIARTFNYGGFKNRKIYDPEIKPQLDMTPSEYKASKAPTINHFYEKLLLLKDRMNTQTATEIAKKRHQYMVAFLDQFYAEWEGKL